MEAVVLAGGYATGLWPITRHRPKMLLPIGETTVIDQVLAELEADDRIDAVYVSTNERFETAFADHLADSDFEKPQLSIEQTASEDEKFGVVGALAQLVDREEIAGEDLLVVAGDNLMGFDMSDFLDEFESHGTPLLAAYDVGSLEKATSYGVLDVDGDRVVELQEKPDDPRSTLVSIACYALPAESVQFAEYLAGDNNPDEPGWFMQWLVDTEPVHAFSFDDAWYDIGTAESYLEAVAWHLEGDSLIADSATLEHTEVGENVHVLGDATITDSRLDRSVVFPGATVADSTLHSSIVDREAHVERLDLAGALIGEHTQVTHRADD